MEDETMTPQDAKINLAVILLLATVLVVAFVLV